MKKILAILAASLMMTLLAPLNVSARAHANFDIAVEKEAEAEESDELNVVQITNKDGLLLSDNSYIVDPLSLVGTTLEGEIVIVRDDGVYINNVRSDEGIKILLGEKVIGWFIEGVVMYVTGYSGEKLAEKTIAMIAGFVSSRPEVVIIAILLFTLTGDTVQAYETADGNECVLNPSGHGYICKYSL